MKPVLEVEQLDSYRRQDSELIQKKKDDTMLSVTVFMVDSSRLKSIRSESIRNIKIQNEYKEARSQKDKEDTYLKA